MKKRSALAVCCAALLGVALAQEEEILSNADIVALTEAGLPASVILNKIKASKTDFDTSVDQLVALSNASVDGAVIEAMVTAGKPPDPQTRQTPTNDSPSETPSSLERALPQPGDTFTDALRGGGRGPEMVVIPAGSFRMGCVSGLDCNDYEKIVHTVTIPQPFAVSKHEVTFEDYDRFTYPNKVDDEGWGRGLRPLINVSWIDAKEYVAWLSSQTGQQYRLLAEAEWEYAARAGSTTKYSWGNDIGCNRANCSGCDSRWDSQSTAPVGSFSANAFGLHDMHGNVWARVEDCWNGGYAGAPSDGSAWLRGDCESRVLRGGSGASSPGSCAPRSAAGTPPASASTSSVSELPGLFPPESLLLYLLGVSNFHASSEDWRAEIE